MPGVEVFPTLKLWESLLCTNTQGTRAKLLAIGRVGVQRLAKTHSHRKGRARIRWEVSSCSTTWIFTKFIPRPLLEG